MNPPSKISKDVNLCEVANFQGNALNFYGFIQIFVFATNHHFNVALLVWSVYVLVTCLSMYVASSSDTEML